MATAQATPSSPLSHSANAKTASATTETISEALGMPGRSRPRRMSELTWRRFMKTLPTTRTTSTGYTSPGGTSKRSRSSHRPRMISTATASAASTSVAATSLRNTAARAPSPRAASGKAIVPAETPITRLTVTKVIAIT